MYGYSIENLDLVFQSLILSVFTYAIEVWGCAFYSKYLSRIDKLFARCYKLGYRLKQHSILDIHRNRDMKLWRRISFINTALSDLLPPQRTPQMRTRSLIIFYLTSGQVVLNQFLLMDICLLVTNIYLVVFLMLYFSAFLYSFYCRVNCCTPVCTMNY